MLLFSNQCTRILNLKVLPSCERAPGVIRFGLSAWVSRVDFGGVLEPDGDISERHVRKNEVVNIGGSG